MGVRALNPNLRMVLTFCNEEVLGAMVEGMSGSSGADQLTVELHGDALGAALRYELT